ncbi:MAG: hypothetical protein GXZ03_00535, partial [Proteiniphilum sp.]|nr:hypothetical protein [Proteiniphilum sp.]
DEIMEVGTVSGNTFSNVTRGLEGTIAVAHEQGAPVENRFTAGTYNRIVDSFNEQKVKVAKVEHELNDLKGVLQQVNINHEAKQKVNDYGIVSLPKNAANGQVSASVKGMTLKNELNYNRDTWEEWTLTGLNKVEDGALVIKRTTSSSNAVLSNTKFKPNTKYGFLTLVKSTVGTDVSKISCYDDAFAGATAADAPLDSFFSEVGNRKLVLTSKQTIDKNRLFIRTNSNDVEVKIKDLRVFELPTGSEIENDFNTMTADQLAIKYPYISGDSPKSTVGAMRLKSVSADETETSTAYVVAKDEEGKIAELRSLPNGVKDEVRVSDKKLIKRVSNITPVQTASLYPAGDTVDYYGVMIEGVNILGGVGTFKMFNYNEVEVTASYNIFINANYRIVRAPQSGNLYFKIPKNEIEGMLDADKVTQWLLSNSIALTYQLATPIEIPIQTSGSLVSYPSGTVYIEPYVADAGIYADKMEVLYSDLPIKALEKISKVDFDTGLETELDITAAVIAEDKLSFT